MKIGKREVSGQLTVEGDDVGVSVIKNEDNIMLNAFRIAVNGSLSVFNMIDGMVDEYEDETGIDTVNSLNEDFISTAQSTDMTLISEAVVAEAAPDSARMVMLEEDVDSITLNTDLKAWASNDDGANWHQGTLSDEGNYDASKRILVADFDVSAQTDTDMVYKLTTYNEKDLKIHGTALSWA